MKKLFTATCMALALGAGSFGVAGSAFALTGSHRYESTLQKVNTPVRLEITVSDDLAYRADHQSRDIRDRANTRSLNDGFSGNGYFGKRELEKLKKRLAKRLTWRLEKNGVKVTENAPTVLRVVIKDAKPNRPTFKQMSKEPSLSMESFAIGGASFDASLRQGDKVLGKAEYGWYESDIRYAYQVGTWSDAYTAMDKFARKLAKDVSGK